jgi:DNA modification methylase
MELTIEYLQVDSLTPYENNTRKHSEADIAQIRESIETDGFNDPIGIWGKDNLIVEGHGRLLAAKALGMETVPCIRLDHLTDAQRRDYAIRHNRTAELSTWDFDRLREEIETLELDGFDLDGLGFDLEEAFSTADVTATITEDEAPEPPEEPKAKRGEIYRLGNHRLMCGDSTSREDVEALMDGERADMVFTDPPYNIASESKNFAADCSKAMENLSNSEWDKGFDIKNVFPVLFDCLSKDVSVYICTSHFLASEIWAWMKGWAEHYSYCVWSKPNPMPSLSKRHWTWNTELICYATRGKHTFNFPSEGHALSTWTINKKNGETGHPTEKPVAVPNMAISHSSKQGDIVLDLFGGSGSTLIACEQLGRKCFIMELEPKYVDVIIQRWEDFTGKKAVLLNG